YGVERTHRQPPGAAVGGFGRDDGHTRGDAPERRAKEALVEIRRLNGHVRIWGCGLGVLLTGPGAATSMRHPEAHRPGGRAGARAGPARTPRGGARPGNRPNAAAVAGRRPAGR